MQDRDTPKSLDTPARNGRTVNRPEGSRRDDEFLYKRKVLLASSRAKKGRSKFLEQEHRSTIIRMKNFSIVEYSTY